MRLGLHTTSFFRSGSNVKRLEHKSSDKYLLNLMPGDIVHHDQLGLGHVTGFPISSRSGSGLVHILFRNFKDKAFTLDETAEKLTAVVDNSVYGRVRKKLNSQGTGIEKKSTKTKGSPADKRSIDPTLQELYKEYSKIPPEEIARLFLESGESGNHRFQEVLDAILTEYGENLPDKAIDILANAINSHSDKITRFAIIEMASHIRNPRFIEPISLYIADKSSIESETPDLLKKHFKLDDLVSGLQALKQIGTTESHHVILEKILADLKKVSAERLINPNKLEPFYKILNFIPLLNLRALPPEIKTQHIKEISEFIHSSLFKELEKYEFLETDIDHFEFKRTNIGKFSDRDRSPIFKLRIALGKLTG